MTQQERLVDVLRNYTTAPINAGETKQFVTALLAAVIIDKIIGYLLFWVAWYVIPYQNWWFLDLRRWLWFLAIAVITSMGVSANRKGWLGTVLSGLWFWWGFWLSSEVWTVGVNVFYAARSIARPVDHLIFWVSAWALIAYATTIWVWLNWNRKARWFLIMIGLNTGGILAAYPFVSIAAGLSSMLPESFWLIFPTWSFAFTTPFVMIFGGIFAVWGAVHFSAQTVLVYTSGFIVVFSFLLNIENQLQKWRYSKYGILSYIYRFWFWLRGIELPEPPPDESKGARFADPREIQALYNERGVLVGFSDYRAIRVHAGGKHVTIMASTRSGKGVTLIIPHLGLYKGSAFVLDPKGENAKATWRIRSKLNNKCYALDPFGLTGKPRARFNPLSRFTPDTMIADSKALADALVMATGQESDPHFIASAQQLASGILLYIHTSPDIPKEHKDLVTFRSLVRGDIMGTLKKMAYSDAADGLVAEIALSFLDTPERERGSMISSLQRQTPFLDDPYIAACLAANGEGEEIDFNDWHKGTMTVYVCLAATKFPEFNRWLRLVLTSALNTMTDRLNPPSLPVCFMLDEVATLERLKPLENAIGLAAGYGVELWTIWQDIGQLRDTYKARWSSFISNASIRVVFNMDDFDTAEYWSKFMGGRLVDTHSRQENLYGLSKGQNIGEAIRPLRAPEELMVDYAKNKLIVLAQGEHPIEADRVPYFQYQNWQQTWDDPRYPVPPTSPPVMKKLVIDRDPDAQPSSGGRNGTAYVLERE